MDNNDWTVSGKDERQTIRFWTPLRSSLQPARKGSTDLKVKLPAGDYGDTATYRVAGVFVHRLSSRDYELTMMPTVNGVWLMTQDTNLSRLTSHSCDHEGPNALRGVCLA